MTGSGRSARGWPVEAARVALLCFVVYAVWATVFEKWGLGALRRPIGYCSDALLGLGLVKSAADFGFVPLLSKVNAQLGAPFAANWNDFPLSEDFTIFFWGMVARLTGTIAALNLFFLSFSLLGAASLYLVGRWLRLRWEACFLAGALFGLSPFLFYRCVYHLTISNYWFLPLFIPVWLWVSSPRGLKPGGRKFLFALAVAALAGASNVYFFNYFLQILGLCIATQLFRGQWKRAGTGALVFAAGLIAFLATNLDTLWERHQHGANAIAIARGVTDVEIYALKPMELFVPPPYHRIAGFAEVGRAHPGKTLTVGEFPSPYVGVVGGGALLWLLAFSLRGMLLGRRLGFGRFGVYSAWLVLVAMVGGGMQIFQALSGQALFRSNNRASIFLFMFALLFLAALLTRLARRWPRPLLAVAVVPLLAFGVYDQSAPAHVKRDDGPVPPIPYCDTAEREKIAAADERLVTAFERRVPPGTMVFQLPAVAFPEAGPTSGLSDYEQFRPYLFSKTLRFSYGNMKGRPQANWQHHLAASPLPQALAELEARGFGALYVMRKAYSPQQLTQLLETLQQLGDTEVLESDYGDSFFAILHPRPGASPPPL